MLAQFPMNKVPLTNKESYSYLMDMDRERFLMGKKLALSLKDTTLALSLKNKDKEQFRLGMKLARYPTNMGKEESLWNMLAQFRRSTVALMNLDSYSCPMDTDMVLCPTGTKLGWSPKDKNEARFRMGFPYQ